MRSTGAVCGVAPSPGSLASAGWGRSDATLLVQPAAASVSADRKPLSRVITSYTLLRRCGFTRFLGLTAELTAPGAMPRFHRHCPPRNWSVSALQIWACLTAVTRAPDIVLAQLVDRLVYEAPWRDLGAAAR